MGSVKKEDFSVKEIKRAIPAVNKSLKGPGTSNDLVEEMQFLYVRIDKAMYLKVVGHPYVQVKSGNYVATTPHATAGDSFPTWDRRYSTFSFSLDILQSISLEVSVKDSALENGAVIGKCSFSKSDARKKSPTEAASAGEWKKLDDGKGQLMMAYWIGTQGDINAASYAWRIGQGPRPLEYSQPKLTYLRVNVIEGKDLVPVDINNKEQPREFSVRAITPFRGLTTKTCSTKNLNPKWNEDLMFVVADPLDGMTLEVQLLEKWENKDIILGTIGIPLNKVPSREDSRAARPEHYNLEVHKMADENKRFFPGIKFASKLHMRISLDAGYHVFDEPIEFASDLRPTAKPLWKTVLGNLGLGILGASGLSDIKPFTKQVDTFCVVKYGPRWVRTCTVLNNSSPKWNEQSSWDVYDPCTFITVAVFQRGVNENGVGIDLFIGKVRIRISTLEIGKVYINSYPLGSVQPSGIKKMGELQLSIRYLSPSSLNKYIIYSQLPLPRLHYILPLSVPQITLLREQTAELLCWCFGRHESPLSSTVVYSLLDMNRKFSRRKALANVKRLKKLYDHFKPLVQWFDYIRKWNNVCLTLFVIFMGFVIIRYPSLTLSVMFVLFFLYGIWAFFKRARQLSHIDPELSLAYDARTHWLDEESDSFPSSRSYDILRDRYDTIRRELFEIQTMIGNLATILERVASLLSWRDTTATFLFTLFCLIFAIGFYINSFPVGYIFYIIFVCKTMPPPNCRLDLPSYFMNFLRRLPSKAEMIL